MKIGILTFYDTTNYGAMLQAYCLYSYVREQGHEAHLIRHKLVSPRKKKKSFKSFLLSLATSIPRSIRKRKFENFISENLSIEDYDTSFDCIVIGSDQVWNLNLTNNDRYYLGTEFKGKISSYAASCGNVASLSNNQIELLVSSLKKFDHLSVREARTQRVLQDKLRKEISLVLDPTLLVDNQILRNIQCKPMLSGRYIVLYDMAGKAVVDFANRMASQIGAKLVALRLSIGLKCGTNVHQCVSVGEFLSYIANSVGVVTTSFHGCAISLSYQKDFYVMDSGTPIMSRMRELLCSLGIDNRMVAPQETITFSAIDYSEVNPKLRALREDSVKFINEILT